MAARSLVAGAFAGNFVLAGAAAATFPAPVSAGAGLRGRKVNMSKREVGYFILMKNAGCPECDSHVLATPDLYVGADIAQEAQDLIGSLYIDIAHVEELRAVTEMSQLRRAVALAKLTKEERVLLGLEKPESALARIVGRHAHAKR